MEAGPKEEKKRYMVEGHFLLSNKISQGQQICHNWAILVIVSILNNVISSAAEAEIGGLFLNGKETLDLRERLREMGHPQNEPKNHSNRQLNSNGNCQ